MPNVKTNGVLTGNLTESAPLTASIWPGGIICGLPANQNVTHPRVVQPFEGNFHRTPP
jgi:hypothetical protein